MSHRNLSNELSSAKSSRSKASGGKSSGRDVAENSVESPLLPLSVLMEPELDAHEVIINSEDGEKLVSTLKPEHLPAELFEPAEVSEPAESPVVDANELEMRLDEVGEGGIHVQSNSSVVPEPPAPEAGVEKNKGEDTPVTPGQSSREIENPPSSDLNQSNDNWQNFMTYLGDIRHFALDDNEDEEGPDSVTVSFPHFRPTPSLFNFVTNTKSILDFMVERDNLCDKIGCGSEPGGCEGSEGETAGPSSSSQDSEQGTSIPMEGQEQGGTTEQSEVGLYSTISEHVGNALQNLTGAVTHLVDVDDLGPFLAYQDLTPYFSLKPSKSEGTRLHMSLKEMTTVGSSLAGSRVEESGGHDTTETRKARSAPKFHRVRWSEVVSAVGYEDLLLNQENSFVLQEPVIERQSVKFNEPVIDEPTPEEIRAEITAVTIPEIDAPSVAEVDEQSSKKAPRISHVPITSGLTFMSKAGLFTGEDEIEESGTSIADASHASVPAITLPSNYHLDQDESEATVVEAAPAPTPRLTTVEEMTKDFLEQIGLTEENGGLGNSKKNKKNEAKVKKITGSNSNVSNPSSSKTAINPAIEEQPLVTETKIRDIKNESDIELGGQLGMPNESYASLIIPSSSGLDATASPPSEQQQPIERIGENETIDEYGIKQNESARILELPETFTAPLEDKPSLMALNVAETHEQQLMYPPELPETKHETSAADIIAKEVEESPKPTTSKSKHANKRHKNKGSRKSKQPSSQASKTSAKPVNIVAPMAKDDVEAEVEQNRIGSSTGLADGTRSDKSPSKTTSMVETSQPSSHELNPKSDETENDLTKSHSNAQADSTPPVPPNSTTSSKNVEEFVISYEAEELPLQTWLASDKPSTASSARNLPGSDKFSCTLTEIDDKTGGDLTRLLTVDGKSIKLSKEESEKVVRPLLEQLKQNETIVKEIRRRLRKLANRDRKSKIPVPSGTNSSSPSTAPTTSNSSAQTNTANNTKF